MLVWATAAVVVVAGAALSAAALAAPPAARPVGAAGAADAVSRATSRRRHRERTRGSRRYAYYTVGDVWKYTGPSGWAAGYVPGELWSCYQLTGRTWWRDRAVARQAPIGGAGISVESPNLGALFFPSFARGYTLTGDRTLRSKALRAAAAMAGRYDPEVGAMLSRPGDEFNVIIDSLMKSQFLWWAAKNGGPAEDAEMAARHARTIARDLVRPDGSTWHIAYYDADTGELTHRGQGSAYSVDSTWARGQAWAMLGFAAAYGETGDAGFLDAARKVSDWYLANVPDDMVPYWDFAAPDVPDAAKDSSAAAIAASALLDLALLEPDPAHGARYEAGRAGDARQSGLGRVRLLGEQPGRAPARHVLLAGGITDRGLAYGDAYLLEALLRLRCFDPGVAPLPLVRARAVKGTAAAAIDGRLGHGLDVARTKGPGPARRTHAAGGRRPGRPARRRYPGGRAAHLRLHGRQALAPRGADDDERRVGGVRDAGLRAADGSLGPPEVQRYDARRRQSHRRGGGLPTVLIRVIRGERQDEPSCPSCGRRPSPA